MESRAEDRAVEVLHCNVMSWTLRIPLTAEMLEIDQIRGSLTER